MSRSPIFVLPENKTISTLVYHGLRRTKLLLPFEHWRGRRGLRHLDRHQHQHRFRDDFEWHRE